MRVERITSQSNPRARTTFGNCVGLSRSPSAFSPSNSSIPQILLIIRVEISFFREELRSRIPCFVSGFSGVGAGEPCLYATSQGEKSGEEECKLAPCSGPRIKRQSSSNVTFSNEIHFRRRLSLSNLHGAYSNKYSRKKKWGKFGSVK